jgi:hypothetical protein
MNAQKKNAMKQNAASAIGRDRSAGSTPSFTRTRRNVWNSSNAMTERSFNKLRITVTNPREMRHVAQKLPLGQQEQS